jgi:hypothetical protein
MTDTITFRAVVDGQQVIRPPEGVTLPQGVFEVTVKPIGGESPVAPSAREAANARVHAHRVSIGRATGIDNEGIDADLARMYGDNP